jgi:Ca-activated chloride channel homolog
MIEWRDMASFLALALLPALALFFVWARRRRQRALETFVAAGLLPTVSPDVDPRRRAVRAGLLTTAVLGMVVALAGPMWGFHWEKVHREGVDLIVAIDTSRSMLTTDVKPNRIARAKLAVQDLLSQLHGDRIGLVAFAGRAFVQCPLTLDYAAFAESLDAVGVGIIPKGGTALAEAIDTSLDAFEGRQGNHQALVLITDGEDHEGKVKDAAKHASERGIKIYTVGIGTANGELIPDPSGGFVKDRNGQVVKSRLDEDTLKEVAMDTGGVYLHAAGPKFGLTELYRDYIAKMDKRELASTLERRFEQRFQIPLAIAFLLLLVDPLIGERRSPLRASVRAWWRRPRRRAAAAAKEAS